MLPRVACRAAFVGAALLLVCPAPGDDDPFADEVVLYEEGDNPVWGYTDPLTALGCPERYTGEGWDPMIVSVMNPPWRPNEVVSIGAGGRLVLRFDTPVTDDPFNPYGIDLLVFGNALLLDEEGGELDHYCTDPAQLFSEGGTIEVSPDGQNWYAVPDVEADGLFPTEGYLDKTDPYDTEPGLINACFTKPVDPSIQLSDFDGLHYEQVLELYRGSGGGAGVDIGPLGLPAISFLRISNPPGSFDTPEIDAVADVAPRRPGDVNQDGVVDTADLLALLSKWGPARPAGWDADFNGDGAVDTADLLTLLAHWD
jgi:hypothetical protein